MRRVDLHDSSVGRLFFPTGESSESLRIITCQKPAGVASRRSCHILNIQPLLTVASLPVNSHCDVSLEQALSGADIDAGPSCGTREVAVRPRLEYCIMYDTLTRHVRVLHSHGQGSGSLYITVWPSVAERG